MGFRFRKSINLGGGFKINLSKSGVGYSWGVKGARITKTARGTNRTTLSIPGTGISYTTESSRKSHNARIANSYTKEHEQVNYSNYEEIKEIDSKISEELMPEEYKEFLLFATVQLKFSAFLSKLWKISGITAFCTLWMPIFSGICFFVSFLSLLSFILLHTLQSSKLTLAYDFSDETKEKYDAYLHAWKKVSESRYVWDVTKKAAIVNARENGNVNAAIERQETKISFKSPWWLKANIEFPMCNLKNQKIILLPDKVLVIIKNKVGAVSLQHAHFDMYAAGYMETDNLSDVDAELLRKQWLYVKKDGEPDLRYKNNVQFPVYKYGRIDCSSGTGLQFSLMISNESVLDEFDRCLKAYLKLIKKDGEDNDTDKNNRSVENNDAIQSTIDENFTEKAIGENETEFSNERLEREKQKSKEIADSFMAEAEKSGWFKQAFLPILSERMQIVSQVGISHLFNTEDSLTLEEKKGLHLNTRAKYSRELIDGLTAKGLVAAQNNDFIKNMYLRNMHKVARKYQLIELKEAGLQYAKIESCGDERDCKTVKYIKKRWLIDEVPELPLPQCKAEYCRCMYIADESEFR